MSHDSLSPRDLWIAALRSGEYKQTTRVLTRLHEDGEVVGYCCLGVACHLASEHGVIPAGENDTFALVDVDGESEIPVRKYDNEVTTLPEIVCDWLSLQQVNGGGFSDEYGDCLASLNDKGATFEQIADTIEAAPPGLFR